MPGKISFTVYCRPQPQGSIKAFIPKGWNRPVLTSTNKNLKSFRQETAKAAIEAVSFFPLSALPFLKHVPLELRAVFFFEKPKAAPKSRVYPVVKPDCDKLARSIFDALEGIIYEHDAQIVRVVGEKRYGVPERTEVTVSEFKEEVL